MPLMLICMSHDAGTEHLGDVLKEIHAEHAINNSVWISNTNLSAKEVRDRVQKCIVPTAELMVVKLKGAELSFNDRVHAQAQKMLWAASHDTSAKRPGQW